MAVSVKFRCAETKHGAVFKIRSYLLHFKVSVLPNIVHLPSSPWSVINSSFWERDPLNVQLALLITALYLSLQTSLVQ